MQYMLFIATDSEPDPAGEQDHTIEAWLEEGERRGIRQLGERLRPPEDATTIRVRNGELLVTDGPFAESKEWVAGFDIIQCNDLDEAIDYAFAASDGVQRADRDPALPPVGGITDVDDVDDIVAAAHQSEWGRIVAGLIRLTGDWTVAEDATQDAFTAALTRWPVDGIPDRPAAWLTTAARNRAIDVIRARTNQQSKLHLLSVEQGSSHNGDACR